MKSFLFLLFISISLSVFSQEILTVDECIQTALDKNIQIKQARNNLITAKANKMQAMFNFLPNLNGNGGYYIRKGNFFDNSVDRFISETTKSFDVNIGANVILFNGLQNKHNLQGSLMQLEAANAAIDDQEQQVQASVLQTYLNILIDKENVRMSSERLVLLEKQLDRAVKRESVGVGNLEDVYNLQSQLATEKLNAVNVKNQLQSDLLTLAQTLRIDPSTPYDVENFDDVEDVDLVNIESYDEIIEEVMKTSPAMRRAKSNHRAAKYTFYASYSNFMPSVSAFYQYSTGYSSNGAIEPSTGQFNPNASFFTQLEYNVQPSYGIRFSIPIFNRYQSTARFQTAKVNMRNAELDIQSAEINMTNTIQSVYQDLVAAQATYVAAQENLESLEQSFSFVNKRYEIGSTDFYTYLESLNNKNRAEIQLINAKYGIIFRKKVLNLYRSL